MKKLTGILLTIAILIFLLEGCAKKDDFESKLAGTWYSEGSNEAAFVLYDDGTCEIAGEYGTGTWNIVNENQLKLTNFYGETEVAKIISVKDGCLSLGDAESSVRLFNQPSNSGDPKVISDSNKSEYEDENGSRNERTNETIVEADPDEPEIYYSLTQRSPDYYADGIALVGYSVNFQETKESYIGVLSINDGEVNLLPCELEDSIYYSDFSDGYAYINYNDDGHRFVIVDTEGKIVYESPSDGNYEILYGEHQRYFIRKKVSGFDINEETYWVLSVDGSMIPVDFIDDVDYSNCNYEGNGILRFDESTFFDLESCNVYRLPDINGSNPEIMGYDQEYLGVTDDKRLIWDYIPYYCDDGSRSINLTDADSETVEIAFVQDYPDIKYKDGVFLVETNGEKSLLDTNGNKIVDLTKYTIYNGLWRYIDNRIVCIAQGQDQCKYFVVIDSNGNTVFEPIKARISDKYHASMFQNDYVILMDLDEDVYKVDYSGKMTEIFGDTIIRNLYLEYIYCFDNVIVDAANNNFYHMDGTEYKLVAMK